MIVFDITREDSFEKALEKYAELKELRGKAYPAILVGNKADLPQHEWF